jgi:DNA adenine methylase
VIAAHTGEPTTTMFLDPPYTATTTSAGTRLYATGTLSHDELFTLAARHTGAVLMTYDDAPQVRTLADRHGLRTCPVVMRSTHNKVTSELLIARDLSWLI